MQQDSRTGYLDTSLHWRAYHEGRDVLLVTSGIAGQSIRKTCQLDGESETVLMSRVADLIRWDIFSHEYPLFDGSFTVDCQQRSVPQSLLTLMSMILYGSNIKNKNNYQSQATMSVSQLLVYNSVRSLKSNPTDNRHSKTREPPLPLFVGAYVHSKTRSKNTIDALYKMGHSVTYDRVLSLFVDLANSAIDHFESVGAVCPQSLKIGLFKTSAMDSIDHDPSSTSSQTSFHGTGISIFQHPSVDCTGTDQERSSLVSSSRKIARLPIKYTSVPPVVAPTKKPSIPGSATIMKPDFDIDITVKSQWCQHVCC